jgi:hypothetical protein
VNAYIHTEKATVRIDNIGPIDMPAHGDPWLIIHTTDRKRALAVVSLTDGTFVTIGEEDPAKPV